MKLRPVAACADPPVRYDPKELAELAEKALQIREYVIAEQLIDAAYLQLDGLSSPDASELHRRLLALLNIRGHVSALSPNCADRDTP